MKIAYICDGCGRRHELAHSGEPMPAGWYATFDRDWHSHTWPWATGIVACSADCVAQAKANVKKSAREDLARFDARVDAAELMREVHQHGRINVPADEVDVVNGVAWLKPGSGG